MLSIIVCSVNRKYLLNFEKNVAETIGDNVEYEILAIDNKVMRLSICAAYNRAASEARYPYLLFIHEDVEFLEKGWWAKVMPQLSKPDCLLSTGNCKIINLSEENILWGFKI